MDKITIKIDVDWDLYSTIVKRALEGKSTNVPVFPKSTEFEVRPSGSESQVNNHPLLTDEILSVSKVSSVRKISGTRQKILSALKNNPNITSADLARLVGLNTRTTKSSLDRLVERNLVNRSTQFGKLTFSLNETRDISRD